MPRGSDTENKMNILKPISNMTMQKNRGIIAFSAITFIFFILAFIAQAYFTYYEIINLNQEDNESSAVLVEQALNSIFLKADLVLLDVKIDLEKFNLTKHLPAEKYMEILRKRYDLIPELLALKIIDQDGNYVGDAEGVLTKSNLSDRTYFQTQRDNPNAGLVISEPVMSKSANKWIIAFSRRLTFANGKFAGIILGTLGLDFFDRQFAKINKKDGAFITLTRRSDNALVYRHPHADALLGKKLEQPLAMRALLDAEKSIGSFEGVSPVSGDVILGSFKLVGDYDLLLNVGDKKTEVLKPWRAQMTIVTIFLLVLGVGGGLLVFKYLQSLDEIEFQRGQATHASKLSALGQMGAGIAHEINNPLAILHGRIEILKKKVNQDAYTREMLMEFFEKSNDMIQRMTRIVKGLRNISRDGSHDPILDESLSKIIHNTLDMCQEKAKMLNIELTIDPIPDVVLACREAELVQVFLNLINNACDAISTLDEKWIHILFEFRDKIEGSQFKKEIIISVIDSGAGIPKNILEKLMQPFFTTKDPGKGTGLGLSISNTIIKNHGGTLEYNEQSGNTRFDVTLPVVS